MNTNNLLEQYVASNHFGEWLGMHFTVLEKGKVDYRLRVEEKHLATPKAAHGGVVSALVDAALGVCALSAVYENAQVVSTVEYKLNFLSPALLGDTLQAIARVEQQGKRLLIVSCDVMCVNRNNQVIAKALGTFNAYDAAKAGYVG